MPHDKKNHRDPTAAEKLREISRERRVPHKGQKYGAPRETPIPEALRNRSLPKLPQNEIPYSFDPSPILLQEAKKTNTGEEHYYTTLDQNDDTYDNSPENTYLQSVDVQKHLSGADEHAEQEEEGRWNESGRSDGVYGVIDLPSEKALYTPILSTKHSETDLIESYRRQLEKLEENTPEENVYTSLSPKTPSSARSGSIF